MVPKERKLQKRQVHGISGIWKEKRRQYMKHKKDENMSLTVLKRVMTRKEG